jgi:hypothetical protein
MTVSDDRSKEMNAGVALLLERMKTNPEEFTVDQYNSSKWVGLILVHKSFLSPEDCKALDEGLNEVLQQSFTEQVLEGLVNSKKSEDGVTLLNIPHPSATGSGGVTLGMPYANVAPLSWSTTTPATLTLGATSLTEQNLQELLDLSLLDLSIDTTAKAKAKIKAQPTTLFGRLFNYQ